MTYCTPDIQKKCDRFYACHLCDESLKNYYNHKEEQEKKRVRQEENKKKRKNSSKKKMGMELEENVVKKWNKKFKNEQPKQPNNNLKGLLLKKKGQVASTTVAPIVSTSARQQKNSGATWNAKGDVLATEHLMECKQRVHAARGAETFTVQRKWLEKQAEEAQLESRRFWLLPFQFMNDSEIYTISTLEQEMELYEEILSLRKRIIELEEKEDEE